MKKIYLFGGNTEKTFTVPIEREVTRIDKNGEEITNYNLLIAQDLWQANYQILSIIFQKKFMKLAVNMKKMKKMRNLQK